LAETVAEVVIWNEVGGGDSYLVLRQLQQRAEQDGEVAAVGLGCPSDALHDAVTGLGLIREAVVSVLEDGRVCLDPVVEERGA